MQDPEHTRTSEGAENRQKLNIYKEETLQSKQSILVLSGSKQQANAARKSSPGEPNVAELEKKIELLQNLSEEDQQKIAELRVYEEEKAEFTVKYKQLMKRNIDLESELQSKTLLMKSLQEQLEQFQAEIA